MLLSFFSDKFFVVIWYRPGIELFSYIKKNHKNAPRSAMYASCLRLAPMLYVGKIFRPFLLPRNKNTSKIVWYGIVPTLHSQGLILIIFGEWGTDFDDMRPNQGLTRGQGGNNARRAVGGKRKNNRTKNKTKQNIQKWHLFHIPKKQSEMNNGPKDVYV